MIKIVKQCFFILASLACIYWWWTQQSSELLIKNDKKPVLIIHNISYSRFNENGNLDGSLFSKEALYLSEKSGELKNIYLMHGDKKISADFALYKNNLLMIKENINAQSLDENNQPINLYTQALNYDLTSNIIFLPEQFIVKNIKGEVKANGGRWENDVFYIENGVKSTYETNN